MQWIPSHGGIDVNENAACLAKKGTKMFQTSNNAVPFYSAKRIIKRTLLVEIQPKELLKKKCGLTNSIIFQNGHEIELCRFSNRHWLRLPIQASKHDT
ncbi:hypothetical protein TNIN_4231 [Trichonephila inaurata madagascariensis]|uniref:RNase H type-1 domain-containing protein n=1 Tax=Trichonephila inaurata madagascariensis TaxID=2747483 RepID=A0A8X7C8V3_9ARAC|nr:hypothetical protein TNIN_4231 [Trichonephila inaurata madagascariensis]